MKYLITIFFLYSIYGSAQIIITNDDISAQYNPGNSATTHTDTIATSVDIGQLGSTSWDFSFLTANPRLDITGTTVDPATTPYHSSYPGANLAIYSQVDFMGISANLYAYLSVNGSFNMHGHVTKADTILSKVTSDPVEPVATFPFTYNSIIVYNGEETSVLEINGVPLFTSITTVVCSTFVDAYGPMTLPGGRVVDALRLKIDEINIHLGPFPVYERNILYTFMAKDGSSVTVYSDTVQSGTGIINNSGSIYWNDALISDIIVGELLPVDCILKQNYPNPFNPRTTIKYQLPEPGFVTIKIHDVLGNEIETLVKEEKPAGTYEVTWNAENLPSGVYFYRIQAVPIGRQAGDFIQTKKMVLMK